MIAVLFYLCVSVSLLSCGSEPDEAPPTQPSFVCPPLPGDGRRSGVTLNCAEDLTSWDLSGVPVDGEFGEPFLTVTRAEGSFTLTADYSKSVSIDPFFLEVRDEERRPISTLEGTAPPAQLTAVVGSTTIGLRRLPSGSWIARWNDRDLFYDAQMDEDADMPLINRFFAQALGN